MSTDRMRPAHEWVGKVSLVEQARILGRNTGDKEGARYWVGNPERGLSILQSNTQCETERRAMREAFDAARAAANPPYHYALVD